MNTIVDEVDENNDKSIENLKTQIEVLNSKQDKIMEQLNRLIEESKDEKNENPIR
jgi:chaperonin cofactor prefoldin